MSPIKSSKRFLILTILMVIFVIFSIHAFIIFIKIQSLNTPASADIIYHIFQEHRPYLLYSLLGVITLYCLWIITHSNYSKRKYLQNLIERFSDGIIVVDENQEIVLINQQFKNCYLNYLDSILVLYNKDNSHEQNQLKEITFTEKNKSLNCNVQISTFIDEGLPGQHLIYSVRNIQSLKDAEKQIEAQKLLIYESSKMASLGEMAAGIAHEINNPLAIINGNLELIKRAVQTENISDSSREKINSKIMTIEKSIYRITGIISALRNLTRKDSGECQIIQVKDFLQDALELAKVKVAGRGIEFIVNFNESENITIKGNKILFGQVIVNLINNAVDAIEHSQYKWIRVEIVESSSSIVDIKITDSGNGIPESIQDKIFEAMFTTKEVGKGTGLGLSLARNIIDKYNGQILLDKLNPHTCFIVRLKIHREKMAA